MTQEQEFHTPHKTQSHHTEPQTIPEPFKKRDLIPRTPYRKDKTCSDARNMEKIIEVPQQKKSKGRGCIIS